MNPFTPLTEEDDKSSVKNEHLETPGSVAGDPNNECMEVPGSVSAKKRKASESIDAYSSIKKKKKFGNSVLQPKNACVTLNEYKAGLQYALIEQSGPPHQPTFVIGVTVNGTLFQGEGRSKKVAKQAAAEAALKSLIQFKNPPEAQVAMGIIPSQNNADFTSDVDFDDEYFAPVVNNDENADTTEENKTPKIKEKSFTEGQNPVMTLNEMKPGLSFECLETGTSPATRRFIMKVSIDGEEFEGFGTSKKLAKQAVAKSALTKLYDFKFTPMSVDMNTPGSANKIIPGTDKKVTDFSLDQSFADRVGKVILERYEELMVGFPQHSRRKVLAGIVMTRDEDMRAMEVISVSTGTKCVNGEYMSVSGTSLNDCHAEIVSRRCLMSYFYAHLENIAKENGTIGESNIFIEEESGGYKLKEGIKFHLYINTAPCGDARIFSPHEFQGREESDHHPNRNSRGQLRTKIESGEGTIPVKSSDGIQTWDGVLQGARLLTMSCSDKVCRWNVLGVQGSLLSYFLQPVYLHSVVLGSLFHPAHMFRALVGRIKNSLGHLPAGYRLNMPRLNLISSAEARQPGKAPNYSMNWISGKDEVEVVDAMKGKLLESHQASRLCKTEMFKLWQKLMTSEKLSKIEKLDGQVPKLYSDAKAGSRNFQEAKEALYKAFVAEKLGRWVEKPMEQDEFEIPYPLSFSRNEV